MNGRQLLDFGTRAIGGIDDRDKRYFYDCLNSAAADFVRETRCLTGETEISTVEGQNGYQLPNDFLALHVKDRRRRLVVKYTDIAGVPSMLYGSTAEKIFSENLSAATVSPRPVRFTITDMPSPQPPVRGTASSPGASDGGLSRLTDSSADFSGISPRDPITNITDGSDGVVISVISGTELDIALFSGKKNQIAAGDVYAITPGTRRYILLDPSPTVEGETITVPYAAMPNPVYTDFAAFRFDEQAARAVAYLGAYKFVSDYDFDFSNDGHLLKLYQEELARRKRELAFNILQGTPYGGYRHRG